MADKKENIFNLIKRINKASKNSEKYHTGLVAENLIVASYKQATISKLEKMRFIINKIIKQKKEFIRVANSQKGEDNKKDIPMMMDENEKEE